MAAATSSSLMAGCCSCTSLPSSSASSSERTSSAPGGSSSLRSCALTTPFRGHARLGSQLGRSGSLVASHLNNPLQSKSSVSQRAGKNGVVIAMAPPRKGKAKKVIGLVKLALEAGKATPAPPVGPALGAKGVNIMAFCKDYNAQTADKPGYIIPVEITIYDDKSFTFILKTPPASVLLKKAAGVEKGSNEPNKVKVGKVTPAQVLEIAREKLPDLNCVSLDSAERIIRGTAKNMGIEIVEAVV